ncbi:MAG TPA: OmpH family outer membrane protein [Bryobacteraceae bacterium]|nr:OmpH family outer membrane protein [Bryobacteraceae bacterium]
MFLLSSALLSAALAVSAQTSAPTKVGIINIQQAIISTTEGQKAAKELEERSAPKKRELEKVQAEINSMRDQFSKMSTVGSEEQKRRLAGDIDQKTKSFNRQVEDAQAELDQEQNKVLNELGGRMLAVLDKYARDNGYAVILDVSSQQTPVLFAATSIDVTREVIDLYNKNVPAAAPPTGGAAAAPPAAKPGMLPPAKQVVPPPAAKPGATKPAPAK